MQNVLFPCINQQLDNKTSDNPGGGTTELYYARVFAELIAFIEDTLANREEQSPIFKLSDLVGLYTDTLTQLCVPSPCVHPTRLKDRI